MKQQPKPVQVIVRKDRSVYRKDPSYKPLIDLTKDNKLVDLTQSFNKLQSISKTLTLKVSTPQLREKLNKPNKYDRKTQQSKDDIKLLQQLYPDIFNPKAPKPLAIGIHTQLRQHFTTKAHARVARLLNWWCRQSPYKKALKLYPHRFSLDGSSSGINETYVVKVEYPASRREANTHLAINATPLRVGTAIDVVVEEVL